jgi:hypothetical protein
LGKVTASPMSSKVLNQRSYFSWHSNFRHKFLLLAIIAVQLVIHLTACRDRQV